MSNDLIGIWKTDPNDIVTQQSYGNVIMDFRANGELIYTVIENDKEQKIFMTYEVKGSSLVTDQISFPQKVVTDFVLTGQSLELNIDGLKSKY